MYFMYINDVLFPITPGKISYKIGNTNKTITLINEGEVNLIKTPGLTDIEISELLLPVQKYPFALYENNEYKTVEYFLNKLETWKKSKKSVSFKLTRTANEDLFEKRTKEANKLLDELADKSLAPALFAGIKNALKTEKKFWNTKFDVTIEDYEILEDADEYGTDVCIKLTMKQYRTWGSKKLQKKTTKKKSSKKKTAVTKKKVRKSKETAKTYTVKKGDCLQNIAKKQLNNASLWKKIYTLNKSVIENTAKKHGKKSSSNGYWIFAGTKLKLPK